MLTTVTVANFRPRFQTQRLASDPHGPANCSAYCLAMGIEFATCGNLTITGRQVRAMTNEPNPDPGSPGLNIAQLVAVSVKLHCRITDQTGKAWSRLEGFVDAGMGCIVQGTGNALASYQDVPFTGPHAVLVTEQSVSNASMLVWNPLNKAYKVVPSDAVRQFATEFGTGTGLRFATTRTPPLIGKVANA